MRDFPQKESIATLRLAGLLPQHRHDTSFFSSPQGGQLVRGAASCIGMTALRKLASDWRDTLPFMAAIPFDVTRQAHVFMPEQICLISEKPGISPPSALVFANPAAMRLQESPVLQAPSPESYCGNVRKALDHIQKGLFSKVVLARSLRVQGHTDMPLLLEKLIARNRRGYTFSLALGNTPAATSARTGMDGRHAQRFLTGASPELLLGRRGSRIISNPLAGSIPRSGDPHDDQQRAQKLLKSAKDRHEHALVVNAVGATLSRFCRNVSIPAEPALLSTPTMWHLSTEVSGELADLSMTSLDLALALHPTPAICGYPRIPAQDFISRHEGFDRGLYAGLVGWCDASGDGEWAVTIRCADIEEDCATLYAGAGIVTGSDPELELAETEAKLQTMLDAMGLTSVLEPV